MYSKAAGGAKALSRDHKPFLEEEKRRIEEAGGMVSMGRVDGACTASQEGGGKEKRRTVDDGS